MQPRTSVSGVRPSEAARGVEFVEIDADNFGSDRMVCPAFFDQRHKQRAGFLERAQPLGLACGGIGMAVHGGVGGDHQNIAGLGGCAGGGGAGLNHAKYRDRHRFLDCIKRERTGGVAGDDEEFGALFAHQKLRALNRIARDGAARF